MTYLCVWQFCRIPNPVQLGHPEDLGAHAALIMATMPLLIGLIAIILDRRPPRWSWFSGMVIAVTGEAALVGFGNLKTTAGATVTGDAIVFAGCVLSATGLIAGARLGSRMNPLAVALWAMTIAAVGFAPLAAAHGLTAPYRYLSLTWATWAAIGQITLGAAVLGNISLVGAFEGRRRSRRAASVRSAPCARCCLQVRCSMSP
jgi:drug/metabolite transporter (DMT)-like permease